MGLYVVSNPRLALGDEVDIAMMDVWLEAQRTLGKKSRSSAVVLLLRLAFGAGYKLRHQDGGALLLSHRLSAG